MEPEKYSAKWVESEVIRLSARKLKMHNRPSNYEDVAALLYPLYTESDRGLAENADKSKHSHGHLIPLAPRERA